jgi:hypothetical protein
MVRKVLRVAQDFAAAHLVRLGIGDLSRPHGGYFGPRHVSHQNGLDVDVYYPRRDRRLRPPDRPADIDRGLSQDLVDAFVRAGATRIFVGPNTGLHGPPAIVQVLAGHDNHVHVRFSAPSDGFLLGRSELGRPIRAWERGDPVSPRRVLVFGCIHGTECAALAITQRLLASEPTGIDLWVVPNANPDGYARGTRVNGRGVDLNRNWPSEWRPHGQAWSDPEYSGARPWSERETRIARDLILRLRPRVTIWFHQPQDVVRAWGPSVPLARRYARLARLPFRRMRWPRGTAPNWQNHRFPESSSFVVELPAGALPAAAAAREARAVLALLP